MEFKRIMEESDTGMIAYSSFLFKISASTVNVLKNL